MRTVKNAQEARDVSAAACHARWVANMKNITEHLLQLVSEEAGICSDHVDEFVEIEFANDVAKWMLELGFSVDQYPSDNTQVMIRLSW